VILFLFKNSFFCFYTLRVHALCVRRTMSFINEVGEIEKEQKF